MADDTDKQIRDELSRHYTSMKGTIKKEREQNDELIRQYRESERERERMTSEMSRGQTVASQYTRDIEQLRRELSIMNERMNMKDRMIREKDDEILRLRRRLEELTKEIGQLQRRLYATDMMRQQNLMTANILALRETMRRR